MRALAVGQRRERVEKLKMLLAEQMLGMAVLQGLLSKRS